MNSMKETRGCYGEAGLGRGAFYVEKLVKALLRR